MVQVLLGHNQVVLSLNGVGEVVSGGLYRGQINGTSTIGT